MQTILHSLERRFDDLHERSVRLLSSIPEEQLFDAGIRANDRLQEVTFAYFLIRSAAEVERVFGGITTRLWDDPFEWTLPEELSSKKRIHDYLNEVELARKKGVATLGNDETLLRSIPAPVELKTVIEILLESLCKAEESLGQAQAVARSFYLRGKMR
ncbi:hypothetical protein [Leptolyngbya sp. 7M]|uniref:hypothetical protein n=1 Tax=Leptolyngbya sp. 7M TaxID=2812896 RepID=UPI001B8D8208|nr:hypothetical protein [Leptolyngbya sp. 7M]QYO66329.1 hypothetical protein JVX88_05885 [Leptolyngbya sp. 7M]